MKDTQGFLVLMQSKTLGKPCYRPKQSPGCICLAVILQNIGYDEEALDGHRLRSTQEICQSSAVKSSAGSRKLASDMNKINPANATYCSLATSGLVRLQAHPKADFPVRGLRAKGPVCPSHADRC